MYGHIRDADPTLSRGIDTTNRRRRAQSKSPAAGEAGVPRREMAGELRRARAVRLPGHLRISRCRDGDKGGAPGPRTWTRHNRNVGSHTLESLPQPHATDEKELKSLPWIADNKSKRAETILGGDLLPASWFTPIEEITFMPSYRVGTSQDDGATNLGRSGTIVLSLRLSAFSSSTREPSSSRLGSIQTLAIHRSRSPSLLVS